MSSKKRCRRRAPPAGLGAPTARSAEPRTSLIAPTLPRKAMIARVGNRGAAPLRSGAHLVHDGHAPAVGTDGGVRPHARPTVLAETRCRPCLPSTQPREHG